MEERYHLKTSHWISLSKIRTASGCVPCAKESNPTIFIVQAVVTEKFICRQEMPRCIAFAPRTQAKMLVWKCIGATYIVFCKLCRCFETSHDMTCAVKPGCTFFLSIFWCNLLPNGRMDSTTMEVPCFVGWWRMLAGIPGENRVHRINYGDMGVSIIRRLHGWDCEKS